MIDIRGVYTIQSSMQVTNFEVDGGIGSEEYIAKCRLFITENLPDEYLTGKWDAEKKTGEMEKLISNFVEKHKVPVEGYLTPDGALNIDLLMSDLKDTINGAGILKEALEDPEVDEIQVNDSKTLFVVKRGINMPYIDAHGRYLQFINNTELTTVLNRLIDDGNGSLPQFTHGIPLLNAKTAREQYRINATHFSVNAMDKPPYNFPVTTITLRKFKEVKLTIQDMIDSGCIMPKMGRFCTLLGRSEAKFFCVGPTGSGKTTFLDIILKNTPRDKRIICIQNPTEISFFDRDATGRNQWNAIHWEAKAIENPKATDGTMANLISNALRCTPDMIICGESRDPEEFAQLFRSMSTGECVRGTFHADGCESAIGRMAGDAGMYLNSSRLEMIPQLAACVDVIMYQYKYGDGKRRVCEIGEIIDADENGRVNVNMLFQFEESGETRTLANGKKEVLGRFSMPNGISPKLKKMFFRAGIGLDEIAEFLESSDDLS